jgi:hypothetical protein
MSKKTFVIVIIAALVVLAVAVGTGRRGGGMRALGQMIHGR